MDETPEEITTRGPARWLWLFLIVCVAVGVYFRFNGLGKKFYWQDECSTSILISGHRQLDVVRAAFTGRQVSPQDLQRFQQIDPGTRWTDTVIQSAVDDPKHPPIYFLMARLWADVFGDSPAAVRALSAVFGVLAIPCMAWLCMELFRSRIAAVVGALLIAVSPFCVVYSQEAREYAMWIALTLAASAMLLRAIRFNSRAWWWAYTICAIVGIYTYTLFAFVVASHVLFVIVGRIPRSHWRRMAVAVAAIAIAIAPLAAVIIARRRVLRNSTSWLWEPISRPYLLGRFLAGLATPFVDFFSTVEAGMIVRPLVISIPVLILLVVALADMFRLASRSQTAFVVCLAVMPIVALLLPDLLLGGRRSFPFRYQVPLYLAAQLCVVAFLARLLAARRPQVRAGAAMLLVILAGLGAASCAISADAVYWWNKGGRAGMIAGAEMINRARDVPVLGNAEGTNFANTIALSRYLDPRVRLLLMPGARWPDLPADGKAFFIATDPKVAGKLTGRYGGDMEEVVPKILWLRKDSGSLH